MCSANPTKKTNKRKTKILFKKIATTLRSLNGGQKMSVGVFLFMRQLLIYVSYLSWPTSSRIWEFIGSNPVFVPRSWHADYSFIFTRSLGPCWAPDFHMIFSVHLPVDTVEALVALMLQHFNSISMKMYMLRTNNRLFLEVLNLTEFEMYINM